MGGTGLCSILDFTNPALINFTPSKSRKQLFVQTSREQFHRECRRLIASCR
jgi:hypothetical protein